MRKSRKQRDAARLSSSSNIANDHDLPLRKTGDSSGIVKERKYTNRSGWGVFTSHYSFWVFAGSAILLLAVIVLSFSTISLFLLPFLYLPIKYVLIPFLIIQMAYFTLTGRWAQFKRWCAWQYVTFRDRFRSVIINEHVAAQRVMGGKSVSEANGFFITMAKPSKLLGKESKKITFDDDRHVTLIAGSRAGKGRSVILPNLASWKGSVIAYDPSGELVRETAAYRRNVLGQKVVVLDPFGITGFESDHWNPMAEIDFDHDPFAIDKCYMLAESIHHQKSPDPYWMHAPRKMLAMSIAYVGTRSIMERCNLGSVRDLLMTSDPSALWMAMAQNDAYGGIIKRFGEGNENRHLEELNSTMELSRTAMKWLDSPVIEQFCQKSTFSMRELKEDKVTIYVVLPAAYGDTYKPWLRLLFNAAFDAMQDTSIAKPDHDTLFLMDEFPLLGHMDRIKRAAGEAAKFGVKLFIAAQDISQLKEHYGQAWETFIANSGLLIMFANNDLETQQYLSNRLGKEWYKKISHTTGSISGSNFGKSKSKSESYELQDVARPDQVEKQVSRQAGEAFYFIAGHKPMRLPRANYDEWGMLDYQRMIEPKKHNNNDAPTKNDQQVMPVAAE